MGKRVSARGSDPGGGRAVGNAGNVSFYVGFLGNLLETFL